MQQILQPFLQIANSSVHYFKTKSFLCKTFLQYSDVRQQKVWISDQERIRLRSVYRAVRCNAAESAFHTALGKCRTLSRCSAQRFHYHLLTVSADSIALCRLITASHSQLHIQQLTNIPDYVHSDCGTLQIIYLLTHLSTKTENVYTHRNNKVPRWLTETNKPLPSPRPFSIFL